MYFRKKQPLYLRKPLYQLLLGLALYALVVSVLFVATEKIMPASGEWRPFVVALPGLGMSTILIVLYLYLRHYDDLLKHIAIRALAASAIGGIVTLIVSTSRAAIGGYAEFNSGLVIAAMAITFLLASLFLSWRHR